MILAHQATVAHITERAVTSIAALAAADAATAKVMASLDVAGSVVAATTEEAAARAGASPPDVVASAPLSDTAGVVVPAIVVTGTADSLPPVGPDSVDIEAALVEGRTLVEEQEVEAVRL